LSDDVDSARGMCTLFSGNARLKKSPALREIVSSKIFFEKFISATTCTRCEPGGFTFNFNDFGTQNKSHTGPENLVTHVYCVLFYLSHSGLTDRHHRTVKGPSAQPSVFFEI
jgi:hypothetical protein